MDHFVFEYFLNLPQNKQTFAGIFGVNFPLREKTPRKIARKINKKPNCYGGLFQFYFSLTAFSLVFIFVKSKFFPRNISLDEKKVLQ